MNQPPLNPDALANLRLLADRATEEVRHAVIEPDILHKLLDLAVAQPVVNSFDPRELNRRGWTCGCEPGDYDECDDCLTAAHELANFLNRPEVKP